MQANFFVSESNTPVYILIKNFLTDKFIGAVYGEEGIGKTYFVKSLLDEEFIYYNYVNSREIEDIRIYLEDLDLDEYTVLVIDDAQHLSLDDFREIFKYYLTNKNLNVIFIGNRNLKQKLNSIQFKNIRYAMNFILELKPLKTKKELEEFLKYYTSENGISIHITNGALKYILEKSRGRIKEVIQILNSLKGKKYVSVLTFNKKRALVYVSGFIIFIGSFLFFLTTDIISEFKGKVSQKNEQVNTDKKPKLTKEQIKKIEEIKRKDREIIQNIAKQNNKINCPEGWTGLVGSCRADTIKKPVNNSENSIHKQNIKPKKTTKKTNKSKEQEKPKKTIKTYNYAIFLGAFKQKQSAEKARIQAKKITNKNIVIRDKKKYFLVFIPFKDEKETIEVLKKLKLTKTFKDAFYRKTQITILEGEDVK